MRILCLGDSLGLPREGVLAEDTWFYKLKNSYPEIEFVDYFERRLSIVTALDNYKAYYQFYPSEIVISQIGIVDCAPRYINENKLVWRMIIRLCSMTHTTKWFWNIVKARPRRKDVTLTKYEVFKDYYLELVNKFLSDGITKIVILVKIGHGDERIEKKSKYFNDNVDYFNKAIDEIKERYGDRVLVVDPLNKVNADLFVDGYHCNVKGNEVVFNSLKPILETGL